MEKPRSRTRVLAEITVFASLYAVLTWVFAPISYQVLQFRISECLKSIVVRRKLLIPAFVIGNFLSNLMSPFIGPWELIWMPLMNLLGGSTAWYIGHKLGGVKGSAVGGFLFAVWIAFGVSFMLHVLFGLPLHLLFVYILIPETILITGFSPVMHKVADRIEERYG